MSDEVLRIGEFEWRECDRFPHGSRQRQVCMGESELSVDRANRFRAMFGIGPLPLPPLWGANKASRTITPTPTLQVNLTPQTRNGRSCRGCGGKAQSQQRPSLLSRAAQYTEAMLKHIADDGSPTSDEDLAFRQQCCKGCPFNQDGTCSLCSCPLEPNLLNQGKLRWRSETCPARRWFRQTNKRQPLVNPKRNLVFHIYPKINAEWNWMWNVARIRGCEHIFNGKRIVSIMDGDGLVPVADVQKAFDGVRIDHWVVMRNEKTIGETAPFIPSLSLVESLDPDEVTMYGHTKGITHQQGAVEQVWLQIMWETCLDLVSVDDALASHAFAGAFKRHMKLLRSAWHYSGAFFWMRHKDIFSKNWRTISQQRAGMEAWPGSICHNNDAACLFHDDPPLTFLDKRYWDSEVLPEFKAWREARQIALSPPNPPIQSGGRR